MLRSYGCGKLNSLSISVKIHRGTFETQTLRVSVQIKMIYIFIILQEDK